MHVQLLRNYSISFSLQYMLYSSLSPMCFCVFSSCSVFESVSLVVSYNSPIWSHFGSVSERCSRRGSSRQHRAHHLAARTFCPSQMTETVHIPESLSLALLRAHQARVDRLKRWHAGLVCWALGYFFFFTLTFQFSVPVSVATGGTSSLGEEVFSTALQSNGNDCAPGETENCICVLECSAVMRKACTEVTGCCPEYLFVPGDGGPMLRYTFFIHFKNKKHSN